MPQTFPWWLNKQEERKKSGGWMREGGQERRTGTKWSGQGLRGQLWLKEKSRSISFPLPSASVTFSASQQGVTSHFSPRSLLCLNNSRMSFRKSTMVSIPSTRISLTRSTPQYGSSASIYGGAGGQGARISSISTSSLRSSVPMVASSSSFKLSSALGGGAGGSKVAGAGIIGDERGAMQNLNDRLANYIETVRNLEIANKELEQKIMVAMEKGGPQSRDYRKYESIIEDLRKKVKSNMNEWIMWNCRFMLDSRNTASVHTC